MTTVSAPVEAPRPIPSRGTPGLRLISSEFRKIFTTKSWWLFGIGSLAFTALALWANGAQAARELVEAKNSTATFEPPPASAHVPPEEVARAKADFLAAHDLHAQTIKHAAALYTSGQFFGLMLVLLLGVIVVTNEFQHQTATTTFLTTPHRTRVIVGKLVAGIGLALGFWVVTELVDLGVGLLFFNHEGLANGLGDWPVQRAILLNGVGYLLWAIFGVGLGTLIRNQIGSVIVGMVIYLIGYAGGIAVFGLIRAFLIHRDGVLTAAVIMPSIASQIMISPDKLYEQSAAWWVGAIVMIGWAVLSGGIGILLMRRRDIS
jgi:ABC-2 type transport system permease protein